jgi:hypothetical protein
VSDPILDRAPPRVKVDPHHPEELRLLREYVERHFSEPGFPCQAAVTDARWLATVEAARLDGARKALAAAEAALDPMKVQGTGLEYQRARTWWRTCRDLVHALLPEDVLR